MLHHKYPYIFGSIYFKLLILVFIITVIIAALVAITALNASKNLILETFNTINSISTDNVSNNLSYYGNRVISLINNFNSDESLIKYVTEVPKDHYERTRMYSQVSQYLSNFTSDYGILKAHVVIIGSNGMIYTSGTETILPQFVSQVYSDPLYRKSLENERKIVCESNRTGITYETRDRNVIMAGKLLYNIHTSEKYGFIIIALEESAIYELYGANAGKGNVISLLSSDGTIVSSRDRDSIGLFDPELLNYVRKMNLENIEQKNIRQNGKTYALLSRYIPFFDSYIINIVDNDTIVSRISKIRTVVAFSVLIIIMLTGVVLFFLSRSITKPLFNLISVMSSIEGDKLDNVSVPMSGSYEVDTLSKTFNKMIAYIKNYLNVLVQEQEQRRKAELNALQMQINPHFLYNTLSTVKYLAWKGDNESVASTVNSLCSLLHNTIGNTDSMISVEDEIRNLEDYALINRIRYGERISISFEIEKSCRQFLMPKLLLQPLVENAFFHAFPTTTENGRISVYVYHDNNMLICEVMDNGCGIPPDTIDRLKSVKAKDGYNGIGIMNVDERIKLIYGNTDKYGVRITSKVNCGTCITVTIPLTLPAGGMSGPSGMADK